MQFQGKTYFVYRRDLAQHLFANGYEGKRVPNVMDPNRSAWEFPLSPEIARFIRDYYNDRNLSAPRFLVDFLSENGGEEGNQ